MDIRNRPISARGKPKRFTKEFLTLIILASFCVFIIQLFFSINVVEGNSMTPTLNNGNIILSCKTSSITRGDIVTINYQEQRIILVKRVIGIPGEYLQIRKEGNIFSVWIREKSNSTWHKVIEPYLVNSWNSELSTYPLNKSIYIPENYFFVMGDNRNVSIDSRILGLITKNEIIGKVCMTIIPLTANKSFSERPIM